MLTDVDRTAHRALCDAFVDGTDPVCALCGACASSAQPLHAVVLLVAAESGDVRLVDYILRHHRVEVTAGVWGQLLVKRASDAVLDVVATYACMDADVVAACVLSDDVQILERAVRRCHATIDWFTVLHTALRRDAAMKWYDAIVRHVPQSVKDRFLRSPCVRLNATHRAKLLARMKMDGFRGAVHRGKPLRPNDAACERVDMM